MNTTPFLLFSICTLFLVACNKDEIEDEINTPSNTVLISDITFNATLLVDGHQYDSLIIENCTFVDIEGDGLQISDVNYLIVRNCVFKNINGNAIRFRNSGSSNFVSIANNEIYNITHNGILAYETHENTVIQNNTIYNVGTELASSLNGSPHHGIYFQGPNFLIEKNTIYQIVNANGNCISIRSYGRINANILHNATKHGVSYYSDHPGFDEELYVENNFIYDNAGRAVNFNSAGNATDHIGKAVVRFNTLISETKSCIGVADGMSDITFQLNGNILVRTDGTTNYINATSNVYQNNNLESNNDVGFVNFDDRNLHLTPSSNANNYANGIGDFPILDFDGEYRDGFNLDAGADQLN